MDKEFIFAGSLVFLVGLGGWMLLLLLFTNIYSLNKIFRIFADSINKSFKKFMHNKLFYISGALTIVATIFFIILLVVQYGSRIGQSTQDGFVLYSFFLIYLAPSISWLIYYLATSKWLTDFIKAQKIKEHEKNQAAKKGVKKREAIKEIKEAKELLDLGVITQAEYDELAEKLKPIILNS